MTLRLPALLPILTVSLLLAGCGDPRHPTKLQGTWKLTEVNEPALALVPELQKKVTQALATGQASMKLDASGQATFAGLGKNLSGVWEVDGEQIKTDLVLAGGLPNKKSEPEVFTYKLEGGDRTLRTSINNSTWVWSKQP